MDKVRFLMSDTGAPFTAACREALEQKGVDVTVVEKDGNKVLQKMLTVRPQVVLLDAFMPGLDALAVKQRYNAAGERHTSFFVTGAFQSEEMVQELLDEGFAYYFVKPFDETVLAARVLKAALGPEKHIPRRSFAFHVLLRCNIPQHSAGRARSVGQRHAVSLLKGRTVFPVLGVRCKQPDGPARQAVARRHFGKLPHRRVFRLRSSLVYAAVYSFRLRLRRIRPLHTFSGAPFSRGVSRRER